MDIETARKSIGKMVMSCDPGYMMIHSTFEPHGPYKLLKVTRAGLAILEGREEHRVPPSLLDLVEI